MKLSKYMVFDSFEEYLSKKDYLSSSDLKKLLESPAHYKYDLENKEDKQTKATALGSAVHCRILEPDEFGKSFYCLDRPVKDRDYREAANKKYKHDKILWADVNNITILDEEQTETMNKMMDSFKKNKDANRLLENTIREASFYYPLEYEGITMPVKIRPDALHEKGGYYVSVKTTNNGRPDNFSKECFKWMYFVSEAFYLRVLNKCLPDNKKIIRGYMIVLETTPPYITMVYDTCINADHGEYSKFLEMGDFLMKRALDLFKECKETNVWGGYEVFSTSETSQDGIRQIELPSFADWQITNNYI